MKILHLTVFLLFLSLLPITVFSQYRYLSDESRFISTSGSFVIDEQASSKGISATYGTSKGIGFTLLLSSMQQSDSNDDYSGQGIGFGLHFLIASEAAGNPLNVEFSSLLSYSKYDNSYKNRNFSIDILFSKDILESDNPAKRLVPAISFSYTPLSETWTSTSFNYYASSSLTQMYIINAGVGMTIPAFSNDLLIIEPSLSFELKSENTLTGLSFSYLLK